MTRQTTADVRHMASLASAPLTHLGRGYTKPCPPSDQTAKVCCKHRADSKNAGVHMKPVKPLKKERVYHSEPKKKMRSMRRILCGVNKQKKTKVGAITTLP